MLCETPSSSRLQFLGGTSFKLIAFALHTIGNTCWILVESPVLSSASLV